MEEKKRYRPTLRRERELQDEISGRDKTYASLLVKYETLQRSNALMEAELKRRGERITELEDENVMLRVENERLMNRSFLDRVFNK